MFTPISKPFSQKSITMGCACAVVLSVFACTGGKPDNSKLAAVEQKAARAADEDGRVLCALDGATAFDRNCTMDRVSGQNGEEILLSRGDGGFRRLRILPNGGGVAVADGAQQALQNIVDDGVLEVTIDKDRYRLPAATKPKATSSAAN